jgi:hypothetical protein
MYADSGILFNQKRLRVDLVHEDEWNSMRSFAFYGTGNPCAPVSPSARLPSIFTSTYGGCDHATGQASFEGDPIIDPRGPGLQAAIPTPDIPQSDNTSPDQRFVLGEEEMADVSLATFYLFDKENAGSDMKLAAVVVRRGCGGCRGCRVWRGCSGCGGCGGCCARWGRCRWC